MTNWYARRSSQNINANDGSTWNDKPDGTGNWLTWASLAAGDSLYANGNTAIAIPYNLDFTCAKISNAAGPYPGTAGGQFTISMASGAGGFHASVEGQNSGTATSGGCLAATLHASNRLTVTGDVTGGGVASAHGMSVSTSNGLFTVTGTITGGTFASAAGIRSSTNAVIGTVNNVTGATGYGIQEDISGSASFTVNGVVSSPNGAVAAITTSGIVTMAAGSSIASNSTTFRWPIIGRIKWETTDTGISITLYDAGGTAHVLKVPDFPAVGLVANGSQFDYTTKTGTRIDCSVGNARYTGTPYYGNPSSLVDGTCVVPATSAVQKNVAVGVSPAVGTLEGIIDSAGAVTTVGCLVSGTRYASGTVSGAGAYNATGVIYGSGSYATEASRNSTTAGASQILTGYSVTIAGSTTNGSATAEAHTANQVLKSAGGNYNDDNLSVGNVRPVAFGIGQTGTLANLVATDAAYVTLEQSRNNDNGTIASNIISSKSVKIRNTTISGSLDMALYELVSTGDSRVASQLTTDRNAVSAVSGSITTTVTGLLGTVSGTLNMSLYELVTTGDARVASQLANDQATVAASSSWIVTGHSILGQSGSYPTTATSQAAQHATDAAFLETNKAEIIPYDTAILAEFGVTGTAPAGGGGGGIDPDDIVLPATDAVDGGVEYGYPDNMTEGTGVNSTTLAAALDAAVLSMRGVKQWTPVAGAPVANMGFFACVRYDPDTATYHAWSTHVGGGGYGESIWHSTSADQLTWATETLALRATPTNMDVWCPCVWREGSTWYMVYAAYADLAWADCAAYYATASDPAGPWTPQGEILGSHSDPTAYDYHNVEPSHVIKIGSTYYLWYCSINATNYQRQIFLATGTSLTSLTRHASNPIFGGDWGWRFAPDAFKFGGAGGYYLVCTHYTHQTDFSELELWYSPNPTFLPTEREFVRIIRVTQDPPAFDSRDLDVACVVKTVAPECNAFSPGTVVDLWYSGNNGTTWASGRLSEPVMREALRRVLPAGYSILNRPMFPGYDPEAIATSTLDLASAIDGKTPREALRYIAAGMAGKLSGAATGTETAYGLDKTTKRVRYTVDELGNRTAVEYDPL